MTATPANSSSRPSKSSRRRWLTYLVAVVLIVLVVAGLRPRPAPVEVAAATYGSLRATVSEEGKTRIKQRYVVSAPVSGQLQRVMLKPGAKVVASETVVASIAPAPASPLDSRNRALALARRDAALAMLEKSRTAQDLAKSELHRVEQLYEGKTLSPQDLEAAQMRETTAARDVVASLGTLRQAEAELADATSSADAPAAPVEVKANATGDVLHVFQESQRVVAQGTPLLEIGDPADLEVAIEMLSRDGAAIAPGARVEFEQWGGPTPIEGSVRLVEPAAFTKISALGVEEQRVLVVADITTPIEQRRSLGDNFRVEAHVIVWENDRVLKVPSSGVFRHGSDWAAYLVRDGHAVLVPVTVGRSSGREVQVLDGLKEGDKVILYPGDRVKNGQRVKPLKV